MKHYTLGRLFTKHWSWFERPHDVPGASMANFFSYEDVDLPHFTKKKTLTSVIDLTRPLEDIRSGMRAKFILSQIEKGIRRGITVEKSDDLAAFYPVYLRFRKGKNLARERFATLKENGILFLASYEGRLVAGGVFIGDGENMRAWVLASERLETMEGRQRDIIGEANRMVLSEAIQYAKHEGYRRFDLGGIEPDSQKTSARSLAEFKEGFGGERQHAYYYYRIYSPLLRAWMRVRRLVR